LSKKTIGIVIAAAVVLAAIVIGIQVSRNSSSSAAVPLSRFMNDKPNVDKLLSGIPQHGQTLGNSNAKTTIVEYVDYKCPICGAASKQVVPAVITKYVRTGLAKMEVRPIAFIGPDSQTGALGGFAAGQQNCMWAYTELDLRNQDPETQKWITTEVAKEIATAAGCKFPAWTTAFNGQQVVTDYDKTQTQSQTDNVTGTPTFVVTGPKGSDHFQGVVPISRFAQAMQTASGVKG
jgi:protein-disulfide isomerase